MLKLPRAYTNQKGELFIGAIIALGLFLILAQAVITLVIAAYDLVNYNRARTNARHLATEQIEIVRNLSFDDVGTTGGIPSGVLPQQETIVVNGLSYSINTSVVYVDDPFDGEAPDDFLPNDYKRVRVDVSWGGLADSGTNTVTMISDVAPRGVETTVGGGTLSILVFDADGDPVPQANVTIVANDVVPPVNLTQQTNDNGRLVLPGAPICNECYEISVAKNGFSTERTYSRTEIPNPNKPHATVLESDVTPLSFAIDRFTTLNIQTTTGPEGNYAPLANQIVQVKGGKSLGTNDLDEEIYKFDQLIVTDSQGQLTIEELEWDVYEVTLEEDSARTISASNPFIPLIVIPDQTIDLNLALSPVVENSLLAKFKDGSDTPIASVSAYLADGLTYESTIEAGSSEDPDWGQVYYDDVVAATYTLQASAEGYIPYNSDVDVDGNTVIEIILDLEDE